MIGKLSAVLGLASLPALALAGDATTAADAVCVSNASDTPRIFAAEAPGAGRRVAELAPGGRLCVRGAAPGTSGVVWVFETLDALEGCARIVPVGRTEAMKKFVEFDRCFWSSNG